MQTGLVSITFRQLPAREIISLCVENKLELIEWGGDVHVPHGDLYAAESVGDNTRQAGLNVAAYGSYYRLGYSNQRGLSFSSVLKTAVILGSPAIRIWPGTIASGDADSRYCQGIYEEARMIADLAAEKGLIICYEFHAKTLTDTTTSALKLLEETAHPAIRTLWQPYNGETVEGRLDSLRAVGPWLYYAHVFHWHPDNSRQPLANGVRDWKRYIEILKSLACPVMLEFVQNDDTNQLAADADILRQLINSS